MSLISGFPSNAKIAKDMYDLGLIAEKDIQKIILFTHFSNPLFIITMVTHHKILVLLAHYIGNLIIGIILRNKYVSSSGHSQPITNTDISFTENLTNAINSSISTLLFILGTIVTFFIISSVINLPIFKFILEISQGLNYINGLDISIKVKTILSGALLSFGGVCVHYQVYGILNKVKIKYMPYLLARIGHVLITIFIILIFYP